MNEMRTPTATPEPYWQGVRRRVRSSLVLTAIFVGGLVVCWGTQNVTDSSVVTISVALVVGFLGQGLDVRIDPLFDPRKNSTPSTPSQRDKAIWTALFLPLIVGLAAVLSYLLSLKLTELDLFGAVLVAMLLGSVAGATKEMFVYRRRSDRDA